MTCEEWLEEVETHKKAILELIAEYHPMNRSPGRRPNDYITAPNAEWAATLVRKAIKENGDEAPDKRFEEALTVKNITTLMTVMNEVWFGFPESIMCWKIAGFREMVTLLEDPPDDLIEGNEE